MTTEIRDDWPSGETGRYLVTLKPGSAAAKSRLFLELSGAEMVSHADSTDHPEFLQLEDAEVTIYPKISVAVTKAPPAKIRMLEQMAGKGLDIQAVEPERYGHVLQAPSSASYADGLYATWGLQATRADKSNSIGAGIRIAVLDSGLDFSHPDFAARRPLARNFSEPGKPAQDIYTHGTHTTGTLCGRRVVNSAGPGYGVAPGAELIVGKVLTDAGWYQDEWLLAGIDWAIGNGAQVISLSLGATAYANGSYVLAYENAGKGALAAGCLIVASAGNSQASPLPVFSPANCPSILAVGAVDHHLLPASFSCVGQYPPAGAVDIAGPGVDVYSSVPGGAHHGIKSGTSMAAPHVAGCAALWAEASGLRGRALWDKLRSSALKLNAPADRVGAGLVQAP